MPPVAAGVTAPPGFSQSNGITASIPAAVVVPIAAVGAAAPIVQVGFLSLSLQSVLPTRLSLQPVLHNIKY